MIFLAIEPKAYPTKTVIEDLMSRDGHATSEDWSPFEGQKAEFERQFQGYAKSVLDLRSFLKLKRNPDFDPTRYRKQTLEDYAGDSTDAANYFRWVCTGYKVDTDGEYIQRKGVSYQPMVEDGESGAIVSMSDLEVTFEEEPDLDNQQLFDKLTYIVKWLWNRSMKDHVHYVSFAIVYHRICEESNNDTIKRHDFKKYADLGKLLRVDRGMIGVFDHDKDQKSNYYLAAIDMLINPSDSELRRMCMSFIETMKELGFSPEKEDPTKYDKEFCESLPCLYVDTESEFRRGEAYIKQIMNAGEFDFSNQNRYFNISVYEISYRAHLRAIYGDITNFIRDTGEETVDWKEQAFTIIKQSLKCNDEMAMQILDKLEISDGYVAMKGTGNPVKFNADDRNAQLNGVQDFELYLLATGDVVSILINPITRDIQYYYSLTTKGGLGYDYINWRRLQRTDKVQ